jgi:hypothetical protein
VGLTVDGLEDPGEEGFFECWYVNPADTFQRPSRVSAGTFELDDHGHAEVRMWAGGTDLREAVTMEITLELPDGDPRPSGHIVLQGVASG